MVIKYVFLAAITLFSAQTMASQNGRLVENLPRVFTIPVLIDKNICERKNSKQIQYWTNVAYMAWRKANKNPIQLQKNQYFYFGQLLTDSGKVPDMNDHVASDAFIDSTRPIIDEQINKLSTELNSGSLLLWVGDDTGQTLPSDFVWSRDMSAMIGLPHVWDYDWNSGLQMVGSVRTFGMHNVASENFKISSGMADNISKLHSSKNIGAKVLINSSSQVLAYQVFVKTSGKMIYEVGSDKYTKLIPQLPYEQYENGCPSGYTVNGSDGSTGGVLGFNQSGASININLGKAAGELLDSIFK